ncbi:MAG: hypothetical protein EXS63_05075 [Candidatus Omnitrophica bacterium]|nr:hypothetical protein [Candidatus Omnitrophota bacterium]
MKRRQKTSALILGLFLFSTPVFAGTATTGDYLADIGTKFVRGLGNILQSPGEIVCGVINEPPEHKVSRVFVGIGKGTVFMLRRLLVGVDEAITFMIPMEATLPPLCQVDVKNQTPA